MAELLIVPRLGPAKPLCNLAGPEIFSDRPLAPVERFCKFKIITIRFGSQTVRRLAKQELRGRVHCQHEEQILQVDSRAVFGDGFDELIDVDFKRVEVADLAADEVWAQQLPRIMPCGAIGGEDAVAQQGNESVLSAISEAPFLKVQGQHRLDVLGFDGLYEIGEKDLEIRVMSIPQGSASVMSHQSMVLGCLDDPLGLLDTDYIVGKRVELRTRLDGLAAMLFDHGTARCADGELPMNVVECVKQT